MGITSKDVSRFIIAGSADTRIGLPLMGQKKEPPKRPGRSLKQPEEDRLHIFKGQAARFSSVSILYDPRNHRMVGLRAGGDTVWMRDNEKCALTGISVMEFVKQREEWKKTR